MNEEYKPINNLWKDSEGYRYFGTLKLSSKIKYDGDDFIPLWEWVNQLQQENKKLKEELECTIGIVEHNRIISEKNKETHQLKDNWEIIRQYCLDEQIPEEYDEYNSYIEFSNSVYDNILNKMQELERSDSNVKD